jgi:hypothetical protein
VLTVSLPTTPSEITRKIGPLQPEHAIWPPLIFAQSQTAKWSLNRYEGFKGVYVPLRPTESLFTSTEVTGAELERHFEGERQFEREGKESE